MKMRKRLLMFPMPAFLTLTLCFLLVRSIDGAGQAKAPQKTGSEGTIRISVGLIQTDFSVVDRQGRFVSDLKAEQFQLMVDGKPHPIDFFEMVTEGAPVQERTLGRVAPSISTASRKTPGGPDSGRTLLFFLDDLHLSADSLMRTRTALVNLIDQYMGVNDRAALFTASRQIGFLQQLSDNKSVLRLAASRLTFNSESPRDFARPVMTEGQAKAIEQEDPDVLGYFIDLTMSAPGVTREEAREIVRGRAAGLAHVSAEMSGRTLNSLRSIVQSCAALPGRKLLFFLSDGFVLQPQKSDIAYQLRLVAEAAARAAIVIYSLDTRGLVVGLPNATSSFPPDPSGLARLDRGFSEVLDAQDGLNALASDTGGRFFKNTNALDAAVVAGMEEGTRYYLLGWHVDPDQLVPGKYSMIRIRLADRPDLTVHVRQSAMDLSKLIARPQPKPTNSALVAGASTNDLVATLAYPWPIDDLPVTLYAGYYYHPEKGYVLDVCFQTEVEGPGTGASTGKGDRIDIMGVTNNRDGVNVDKFRDSIGPSVEPSIQIQPERATFGAVRMLGIDPGLYQVRVAARDPKSGRLGSAHQWVDVPRADLLPTSPRKILLSSIFLRRKPAGIASGINVTRAPFDEQQFSAARRYLPGILPFFVQIYNAASPSLTIQTRIYRGNQVVSQTPAKAIASADAGAGRPFFIDSEISLEGLPAGSYVLEVIATETPTGASAKQQVSFWIRAE